MTSFGLSRTNIIQKREEAVHRIERAEEDLESIQSEINRLKSQERHLEAEIRRQERTEEYLTRTLLALEHQNAEILPTEVLEMRESIIEKIHTLKSKDIFVSTAEKLRKELRELQGNIVKICPHPYIVDYQGYTGSDIDDYDDRYPARRRCVVCNYKEESYDKDRSRSIFFGSSNYYGVFKELTENIRRTVIEERRIPTNKRELLKNIWIPLEDLLEECFIPPRIREEIGL